MLFKPEEPIQIKIVGLKPESRGSKTPRLIYAGPKNWQASSPSIAILRGNRAILRSEKGYKQVVLKNGYPVVVADDSNPRSKKYMEIVGLYAQQQVSRETIEGAVELSIEFVFERPKYHFGTGKNAGTVKAKYQDERHTKTPDLSKIIRPVEDALTQAGIWKDDSQIVSYGSMSKRYGAQYEINISIQILD